MGEQELVRPAATDRGVGTAQAPGPGAAVEGSATVQVPADAYDAFMGRYSRQLAVGFFEICAPAGASSFLDVGCGPGALTSVAVDRLGPGRVSAVDPSPGFVAACRARHPGVDVRCAPAEQLPFDDGEFGSAAAQLVLHFVSDPARAAAGMVRVVRPGGVVAAAVWDLADEMEMLRAFWDAALSLDADAPDEARTLRFGGAGELTELFRDAGLADVREDTLAVTSGYRDFGELWAGFLSGIGPAGAYTLSLSPERRDQLGQALHERLSGPQGLFELRGVARVVAGNTRHH